MSNVPAFWWIVLGALASLTLLPAAVLVCIKAARLGWLRANRTFERMIEEEARQATEIEKLKKEREVN